MTIKLIICKECVCVPFFNRKTPNYIKWMKNTKVERGYSIWICPNWQRVEGAVSQLPAEGHCGSTELGSFPTGAKRVPLICHCPDTCLTPVWCLSQVATVVPLACHYGATRLPLSVYRNHCLSVPEGASSLLLHWKWRCLSMVPSHMITDPAFMVTTHVCSSFFSLRTSSSVRLTRFERCFILLGWSISSWTYSSSDVFL